MFFLDHVGLAVRDLDAADRLLRERFGLGSVPGGAHPQWGTANRIVPIGEHFIEIIAVTDPQAAERSPVGRYFGRHAALGDRFVGLCLGPEDRDGAARQLGVQWVEGSRLAGGGRLTFRSAGLERALEEDGGWPYFLQYDDWLARLGDGDPGHRIAPKGIALVELRHDVARLRDYLGGEVPGLALVEGAPAILRLVIDTADGPLELPGSLD